MLLGLVVAGPLGHQNSDRRPPRSTSIMTCTLRPILAVLGDPRANQVAVRDPPPKVVPEVLRDSQALPISVQNTQVYTQ